MIRINKAKEYSSLFNTKTGLYVRNEDPFVCPVGPELLDISITNKCTRECGFCYMNSSPRGNGFLTLGNLKKILKQCKGVFQIALGGGEPTIHPQFTEILKTIRKAGIVPNLTTNGDHLTLDTLDAMKEYCGAVAVSVYDQNHTWLATQTLLRYGIKTNWHWILSKKTISKATEILTHGPIPKGLNAIIFLLHKPMGRGKEEDGLRLTEGLEEFINRTKNSGVKIGFDACSMNYLVRYHDGEFPIELMDFCDAGRYSAYIDWDLNVKPCSFNRRSFGNLKRESLKTIWKKAFASYRFEVEHSLCEGKCEKYGKCYSGCPILPINLCEDRERIVQAGV